MNMDWTALRVSAAVACLFSLVFAREYPPSQRSYVEFRSQTKQKISFGVNAIPLLRALTNLSSDHGSPWPKSANATS